MATLRSSRGVLDQHAVCMREAAERRGIATADGMCAFLRNGPHLRWLTFTIGNAVYFFRKGTIRVTLPRHPGEFPYLNGFARPIMRDKARAKAMLTAAGISVPDGRLFSGDQRDDAAAYIESLSGELCVKPNTGRKGNFVFPGRRDHAAVLAAFEMVAAQGQPVLIEESVPGEVIRFFYVRPRIVGVKISLPANVVGDGHHTISGLIALKNEERRRRNVPGHNPITVDFELVAILAGQGLALTTVPALGERVMLRLTSNGAVGADSIECADDIHPSYAEQVEAACRAIPGVQIAAIDTKVLDRRTPSAPGNHWILEVNTSPGVLPYHYPWEGRPQDVSGAVMDLLIHIAPLLENGVIPLPVAPPRSDRPSVP